MGIFRTACRVENILDRQLSAEFPGVLVDTVSELSWLPERILESIQVRREKTDVEFLMANGQRVTRSLGFAILRVDGSFTVDEVVFGEAGDQQILGARTLEGLNLVVDPARKRLVAAGPMPAA